MLLVLQEVRPAQASPLAEFQSEETRAEELRASASIPPVVQQEVQQVQQQASKADEAVALLLVRASSCVASVRQRSTRLASLVPRLSASGSAACGERCPIRCRRDDRPTARQTSIRWGMRLSPCQSP